MQTSIAGKPGMIGRSKQGTATFKRRLFKRSSSYPAGHHDFRPLVGGGGWARLPKVIRARFDAMSDNPELSEYTGSMKVERSLVGWAFAWICKLFGSPLVVEHGDDVPTVVRVFPVDGGGICWRRILRFPNRAPITVESVKVVDVKHGLLECVGGRLGMRLKVYEEDGTLNFASRRYFFVLGGKHIPLPLVFTPGALHVRHSDVDETRFRFYMTFRHPWFGVTFLQDGVFADLDAEDA